MLELRKDIFADERDDNLREIGKPTQRQDMLGHVTATSTFFNDHKLQGMLHLKVLEESGLVTSQKVGRVRTCRVDPKMLSQAESWVAERRQMWERSLDRLGAFLDETKPEGEA